MTLPIILYGSYTCEDTAITRDRLNTLHIPFKERAKEDDESVVALLGKYNQGMARTPTIVFGDDEIVIAEPTVEQLEESLIKAGYTFDAPSLRAFNVKRYTPDVTKLPVIRPPSTSAETRDVSKSIWFFAHVPACRVCQGYAKQITTQRRKFEELGARLQIVLRAELDPAKKWVNEFATGVETRADGDGSFKRESVDCFPDTWDIRTGGTWLWLVDNEDVIRAGAYAPDAGGLTSSSEVIQFLTKHV